MSEGRNFSQTDIKRGLSTNLHCDTENFNIALAASIVVQKGLSVTLQVQYCSSTHLY